MLNAYLKGSSVQFSCSVVSDSLRPHESQHFRPPCLSPTPRVHWDSCSSSRWCHPAISSSVVPFSSCPQSLPASESFPMSQLFAWGGQSTGVSNLASFLQRNPRADLLQNGLVGSPCSPSSFTYIQTLEFVSTYPFIVQFHKYSLSSAYPNYVGMLKKGIFILIFKSDKQRSDLCKIIETGSGLRINCWWENHKARLSVLIMVIICIIHISLLPDPRTELKSPALQNDSFCQGSHQGSILHYLNWLC